MTAIAPRPKSAAAEAVMREPAAFASVVAAVEAPEDDAAGLPEAAEVLEASEAAPDVCAAAADDEVTACDALPLLVAAAPEAELALSVAAAAAELEPAAAEEEAGDCVTSASSSTILTPHLAWKSKSGKGFFQARQPTWVRCAASICSGRVRQSSFFAGST